MLPQESKAKDMPRSVPYTLSEAGCAALPRTHGRQRDERGCAAQHAGTDVEETRLEAVPEVARLVRGKDHVADRGKHGL